MSKTYENELETAGLVIVSNSPVDDRLVVGSKNDLFNWGGETFGDYAYSGMPVFVFNDQNAANNGLYMLTRASNIQYIRDPNGTESQPDTETRTPGISNTHGWMKIAALEDIPSLNLPQQTGDYILTITQNGTPSWTPKTDEIPAYTSEDNGKVLTVIPSQTVSGEYTLGWTTPPSGGGFTPPSTDGKYVLQVTDSGTNWSWVTLPSEPSGINIKNFSTQTDIDQTTGRHIPATGGALTAKTRLSNSGEIIAADVDNQESQDPDGPDRPFKLMINYDVLNLTINGGNAGVRNS